MKDTLVVLNYQREIPPFLQTVLHYAETVFERVLYITPELYRDNRADCHAEKLDIYQMPRRTWRYALCTSPRHLFEASTRRQIALSVRNRLPFKAAARNLLAYNVCSDLFVWQVRELLRQGKILPEHTVLLSAWFYVETYAAVRLKCEFPAFRVVSYAHAFEIKESVNPCAYFSYNEQKHNGCDDIVFISQKTQKAYLAGIQLLYPHIRRDNMRVAYLGSIHRVPGRLAPASGDGVLRIVSCSSAVKVKRIDLILQAVALYQGPIHWTHIGGGPLLDALRQEAEKRLAGNPAKSVSFTGAVTNRQVQEYYAMHPVDLFVNVSASEGLPVSIMEAMSYGIPVVATDVGGTGEIVTKETGFLLEKDFSPRELCDVLRAYVVRAEAEKEKFRTRAREMWQAQFDGEVNTLAFLNRLRCEEQGNQ